VVEDLKRDVVAHKDMLVASETKREELQVHIQETSVKVRVDNEQHTGYQAQLIDENQRLQNEIQKLKAFQAQREQAYLAEVARLNQEHHDRLSREQADAQ